MKVVSATSHPDFTGWSKAPEEPSFVLICGSRGHPTVWRTQSDVDGRIPMRQVTLAADGLPSVEGTGHWLMLEKPADFNAALIRMLQEFDLIGN